MWVFWALLSSITYCISLEINKKYKLDGFTLVFWQACLASVYLTLLIPFMYWPENPVYYIVLLVMSTVSVIGLMVQFNLAAQHNGRVANLQQPISTILTFAIWLVIDDAEWLRISTDYMHTAGVAFSFILMIVSLQFIRKNDTSWSVFITIFPIGVLYAITGILTKLALDIGEEHTLGIALNWVWLGSVMMVLVTLPVMLSKKIKDKNFNTSGILLPATIASVVWSVSWVSISIAIIGASNPAYPAVIMMLAPLWFKLYYKARGIEDDISPLAGFGLSISALVLLLVTL